jgi:hypothetical protein
MTANPYEIMVTDGNVHDIDEDDLDRWYALMHFVVEVGFTPILGANISSIADCTVLHMLASRGVPSRTRKRKLDSLCFLGMASR